MKSNCFKATEPLRRDNLLFTGKNQYILSYFYIFSYLNA